MYLIKDATQTMLTRQREHDCLWCGSKFAFLLDDVVPVRRMDFFLFIPVGYIYSNYYIACPVCSRKIYLWGSDTLNYHEAQYLMDKDKKERAAHKEYMKEAMKR